MTTLHQVSNAADAGFAGRACPTLRECRLKSDALRLTIGEVDGEEPVRAIETLELHLATLGELDS